MNLNQYVGKKIQMRYASPGGETVDVGLVKSSNNNAAITLLKQDTNQLITIGVYRIIKIELASA